MRKILASMIILAAPTSALSESNSQIETMCDLLQHSTTTSLIAIQDMGLELSDILIEDLENDGAEAVLGSKVVLDQGFESFKEVLKIAKEAQTICQEHFEPVFVQTFQTLS